MTAFRFRFAVLRTAVMKISIPADSHLVQRRFGFRLERVLHVRNTQLKNEEFKLEALLQQRVRMEAEITAADTLLVRERQAIESAPTREAPTCWSLSASSSVPPGIETKRGGVWLLKMPLSISSAPRSWKPGVTSCFSKNCARNGTLPGREKRIKRWKN